MPSLHNFLYYSTRAKTLISTRVESITASIWASVVPTNEFSGMQLS